MGLRSWVLGVADGPSPLTPSTQHLSPIQVTAPAAEPRAPAGVQAAPPASSRGAIGAPRVRPASALVLFALGLFLLALTPRLLHLDQHATADEDLTLTRSANVALALARHDWWGTYQIGHPEATVNVLVAVVLGPAALQPYAGEFLGPDARTAAATPGYFETLVRARQVLAPVHALLVAVIGLLVWLLWGRTAGLVAGLLLALDPFLVAHGRILRTDALLSELLPVAVLAALAFWSGRAGAWALVVCAAATGLALLTKTPSLALLGAIPVTALAGTAWRGAGWPLPSPRPPYHGAPRSPRPPARGRGSVLVTLALWLAGSIGVLVAVWPAMWARPLRALERMAVYTQEKGGSPMDAGGFFLGSPIADPGPLYYASGLAVAAQSAGADRAGALAGCAPLGGRAWCRTDAADRPRAGGGAGAAAEEGRPLHIAGDPIPGRRGRGWHRWSGCPRRALDLRGARAVVGVALVGAVALLTLAGRTRWQLLQPRCWVGPNGGGG